MREQCPRSQNFDLLGTFKVTGVVYNGKERRDGHAAFDRRG